MYLGLVVRNKYVFVIKQFYYCLKMTQQTKVTLLHNRSQKSYFAPYSSYFAPSKKLVNFWVNFFFVAMQVPKVNVIYRVTISEIRSVIDQRARITIERINNIGMA